MYFRIAHEREIFLKKPRMNPMDGERAPVRPVQRQAVVAGSPKPKYSATDRTYKTDKSSLPTASLTTEHAVGRNFVGFEGAHHSELQGASVCCFNRAHRRR